MPDDETRGPAAAVGEAALVGAAEKKLDALVELRRSVVKERWGLRILTLCAVLGTVAAIFLAVQAQENLDTFRAERARAAVATCTLDNENAKRVNGLNDRAQDVLRLLASPMEGSPPRPPERQAEIDEVLNEQLAAYEALKVPLRDCRSDAFD